MQMAAGLPICTSRQVEKQEEIKMKKASLLITAMLLFAPTTAFADSKHGNDFSTMFQQWSNEVGNTLTTVGTSSSDSESTVDSSNSSSTIDSTDASNVTGNSSNDSTDSEDNKNHNVWKHGIQNALQHVKNPHAIQV
jgi:hypothetical protein